MAEKPGKTKKLSNNMAERAQAVRDRIEREMERAREEKKREQMQRRIEIARVGLKSFEQKDYKDAIRNFLLYLSIMNEMKKIPDRTLNPTHFNIKTDVHEVLLISTVYWHLLKIYDRIQGDSSVDFNHFLNQFVLFTRGMPFQPLAAETMRKYIRAGKPKHKTEFKAAYKMITGSSCFVVTSLMDLTEDGTLESLRSFRDQTLSRTLTGKAMIRVYYGVGPALASLMDRAPESLRKKAAKALDRLARRI